MTAFRVKRCAARALFRFPALLVVALALVAGRPAARAVCPSFQLPPVSEQATNPPRFSATDGAPASFYHILLTNVPAGYSIGNGGYLAWCIDYWVPLPNDSFLPATLLDSTGPLPPFLQSTNWDMVNYILNHKQGTAFDVQGAIWHFIGGPIPLSDPAFNPPSVPTQLMILDALAHGEGFLPTGPGEIVAVVLDAGPQIQTLILEGIAPERRPPVANPDVLSTLKDTVLSTNTSALLANDLSPNGAPLHIIGFSPNSARGGTVAITGTNIVYTPPAGFTGTDSFTYTVGDGVCDNATAGVSVRVIPRLNQNPNANADAVATLRDQPVIIPATLLLANDTDPDGDALVIVGVSTNSARGGTVLLVGTNLVYTPPPGFVGVDSFTYTVSDGWGGTATATVTVTVVLPNGVPTPMNDFVSVRRDQPLTLPAAQLLSNDTDPDGDLLGIISVSSRSAQGGTVVLVGTNVLYTPPAGFIGTDTFTYTVSDGHGNTASATVNVTVNRPNAAPLPMNDSVTVLRDQPIVIPAAQLLSNDSDADGDTLMIIAVSTNSAHGGRVVLNGTNILYTPPPGFVGTDTFTYTVSDGQGGTATATVTVTVVRPNAPPVAVNDSASTVQDVTLRLGAATLLSNDSDPDGDTLTVVALDMMTVQHGSTMLEGTNILYFPPLGFVGRDSFHYTISDGHGGTATATVEVTVRQPNHPPMAGNFAFTTLRNTPLDIPQSSLLALASDPDGDTIRFDHAMAASVAGGVAVVTNGSVRYMPRTNYSGADSFYYVITDGRGLSATGTVMITVLASPLGMLEEAAIYNPQTGLFEQRITVFNESSNTIAALRIYVSNLRTNIRVWNAAGAVNGTNFVQYGSPLNPGQTATFRIEYYVPDRLPFTPVLRCEETMPIPQPAAPGGAGIAIDRSFLDTRLPDEPRVVIEFNSTPGRIYTIIYSDDMTSWKAATPSVRATANRTQWYDDGPPKTNRKPASMGSRFYRVIQAP